MSRFLVVSWFSRAQLCEPASHENPEVAKKGPQEIEAELAPFIASMHAVPKSGLHNSLKDPGQFFELGEVNGRASIELRKPEVANFFGALPRSPHPPGGHSPC